jgi:hypothetical protein
MRVVLEQLSAPEHMFPVRALSELNPALEEYAELHASLVDLLLVNQPTVALVATYRLDLVFEGQSIPSTG